MDDRHILRQEIEDALLLIIKASINELQAQGHVASGRGVASFESRVVSAGASSLEGEIWGEEYLRYLDTGTRPHFPPVDEIKGWLEDVKPGFSEEEITDLAWRIAYTIDLYGTPTPGSYEYTKNGRRTEWTKYAQMEAETPVRNILERSDWVKFMLSDVIPRQQAA